MKRLLLAVTITIWVAVAYWVVRIILRVPPLNAPILLGVGITIVLACFSTWETFRERRRMRDEEKDKVK